MGNSEVIGIGGRQHKKSSSYKKITDPSRNKERLRIYWKPIVYLLYQEISVYSTAQITDHSTEQQQQGAVTNGVHTAPINGGWPLVRGAQRTIDISIRYTTTY